MKNFDTFLSKDTRAQVAKDVRPIKSDYLAPIGTGRVEKIGWTEEARAAAAAARKATGGKHEPKWNQYAGGTGAATGKYGYDSETAHGKYSINPISSQNGHHQGYSLTIADTQGKLGGGLHQTIRPGGERVPFNGHEPSYRSPQDAKTAASQHASRFAAGETAAQHVQAANSTGTDWRKKQDNFRAASAHMDRHSGIQADGHYGTHPDFAKTYNDAMNAHYAGTTRPDQPTPVSGPDMVNPLKKPFMPGQVGKAEDYKVTEEEAGDSNGVFRPLAASAETQIGGVTVPRETAGFVGPKVVDIDGDQDSIAQETTYAPAGVHIPGAVPSASLGKDLFSPVNKDSRLGVVDPSGMLSSGTGLPKKPTMRKGEVPPGILSGDPVLQPHSEDDDEDKKKTKKFRPAGQ